MFVNIDKKDIAKKALKFTAGMIASQAAVTVGGSALAMLKAGDSVKKAVTFACNMNGTKIAKAAVKAAAFNTAADAIKKDK